MIHLTQSLKHWLFINHKEVIPLLMLGHLELFTPEMQDKYVAWCGSEEGLQYLKGGSKYEDSEENRVIERMLAEVRKSGKSEQNY